MVPIDYYNIKDCQYYFATAVTLSADNLGIQLKDASVVSLFVATAFVYVH